MDYAWRATGDRSHEGILGSKVVIKLLDYRAFSIPSKDSATIFVIWGGFGILPHI